MSMAEGTGTFQVLHSSTTRYKILGISGEGGFGRVARCVNLGTQELVAIKMHKLDDDQFNEREFAMLEKVCALNPDQHNIVKFIEKFQFNGMSCLAFEMLDRSLFDLMIENDMRPRSLCEIRLVTQQLLVALKALKNIGIIHTDLKPDNIMLVNQRDQPFRIKLIDFGLARPLSHLRTGMTIQHLLYRAPEVVLGLPLSESVDMWGLGCIVAYLYFGVDFFPDTSEYDWMKALLHWLGQPNDELISAGKHSWMYFTLDQDAGWRLSTPDEYEDVTGVRPLDTQLPRDLLSLEDAVMQWPVKPDEHEYEERMAFSDFIKGCLNVNAEQRMTPSEALNHPFITMAYLEEEKQTNSNTGTAFPVMNVPSLCCGDEPINLSDGEDRPDEDDDVEVSRDDDIEAENSKPSVNMCVQVDDDFSVSSKNDSTAAIRPVDGEDHKTASDRARRKKPFHSISKFFRRMQKRVVSIFKPQKKNLPRKEEIPVKQEFNRKTDKKPNVVFQFKISFSLNISCFKCVG